jgi:hypothetical protein
LFAISNINHPSSDFLEIIMPKFEPNIKSIIKNNKKILLWQPGSNIESDAFTGLNFKNYDNLHRVLNITDLQKYTNQEFDYFFIHGYELRHFDYRAFIENTIKIKNFCIDLLGEGFDINCLLEDTSEKLDLLKCEVKILIPFNHYLNLEELYPKYKFFKYELGGPRFFCSRYNRIMIHGNYRTENEKVIFDEFYNIYKFGFHGIVYGLEWSDKPKDKLFMCLNGAPREHRILMYKKLIESNQLDNGYVTFKSNNKNFNLTFCNEELEVWKSVISVSQLLLDEINFESKFGLHTPLAKNCYIELVTESRYGNLPFKTEKCVKPFYNLQFPIILGHEGIIEDLRKMDFDMFDDIINHSYDNVPTKSIDIIIHDDISTKCDLISKELVKLSKLDIHSLYLKNKERFLYNQENLYKKTIIENNIFQDLGKFIFGDDIEVIEMNFDKIEKLIIS